MDSNDRGWCEVFTKKGKESLGRFEYEIETFTPSGQFMKESIAKLLAVPADVHTRMHQARNDLAMKMDDGREASFYAEAWSPDGTTDIQLGHAPYKKGGK